MTSFHTTEKRPSQIPASSLSVYFVYSVVPAKTTDHTDHTESSRRRALSLSVCSVYSVVPTKTTDHTDHTESSRRRASPFPCIQWFQTRLQNTQTTQKVPAAALLSFRVFSVFRGSKW